MNPLSFFQRFGKTYLRVVHDTDLIPFLEQEGYLEKIRNGEVRCKFTGDVITIENLEGVIRKKDGYDFVSHKAIITGKIYGN